MPSAQFGEISFLNLFEIGHIQRIQDTFANSTNVASIITQPDGRPITKPSNFCRLCSDVIRKTPLGLANCMKSDAVVGSPNPGGPVIMPCLSGGLWDAGASIMAGDKHIANWLIGQVRNEKQDENKMLSYARAIGADEAEFISALREVKVMSLEQFTHVADTLFLIANQLSELALKNLQQAQIIKRLKDSEERLTGSLKEKEILLREVHHRVKNNMAIISSMLHMQAGYCDDDRQLNIFKETQGRIKTMALVHEKIYQSANFASVDVEGYVVSLSDSILIAFAGKKNIKITMDIERLSLDIDTLIPCGLIINELLTNACKHAFGKGQPDARINIELKRAGDNRLMLAISDNGVGMPAGVELSSVTSLGLKLVSALVAQLGGEMQLKADGGTNVTIYMTENLTQALRR